MKVLIKILIIFLALVFDTAIFPNIGFLSVVPDMSLCVAVSFALLEGSLQGAIMGLGCGLLIDITCGSSLGFYALQYVIVGYLAGILSSRIKASKFLFPSVTIAISYFIKTGVLCILLFFRNVNTNFFIILATSLLGALLTALWMQPVHFLNRKLHNTRVMKYKSVTKEEFNL